MPIRPLQPTSFLKDSAPPGHPPRPLSPPTDKPPNNTAPLASLRSALLVTLERSQDTLLAPLVPPKANSSIVASCHSASNEFQWRHGRSRQLTLVELVFSNRWRDIYVRERKTLKAKIPSFEIEQRRLAFTLEDGYLVSSVRERKLDS
jgi:hypothetical protein